MRRLISGWSREVRWMLTLLAVMLGTTLGAHAAGSGIAYGSLNNFDTVNDTGVPCHGFEIELEDIESVDITYTFDWNHYGTPSVIEDSSSSPGRTNVIVRYASRKNADGTWAAYTAVPSGPIAPTDGHRFTDPSVNFGGEHFGVGYRRPPTAVKYFWLIDDGAGNLVRGGAVNVATPTFTYMPPAAGAPARVQAAIEAPEPPEVPVREFGEATWVKEIRTTTHNHREIKLRDLVSDDPDDPEDKNWRNGEPDEVEVEWELLQREFKQDNGGEHGKLAAAAEDLPKGDEVVTRRYEFYKYVGPLDEETGEARASRVGPDGIHGAGIKRINGVDVDLSTVVVVGDYIGAQMSAFDAESAVGLIDHLEDGVRDEPYTRRTVVIAGNTPVTVTTSGALPEGMSFDLESWVLSGTPQSTGVFSFTVSAAATNQAALVKSYTFTIAEPGEPDLARNQVETAVSPADAGTVTGDGLYSIESIITVTATPAPGFSFVSWTENGHVVSRSAGYQFTTTVNRALIANFVAAPRLTLSQSIPGTLVLTWPTNFVGYELQRNGDCTAVGWTSVANPAEVSGPNYQVMVSTQDGQGFFRVVRP